MGELVRILVVDFDGLRTGASASELPLAPSAAQVDLVPLPPGSDLMPGGTPHGYSQWLLERVREPPEVLVGYCVGASIAVQLAARLERVHDRPLPVALIDPAEAIDSSIREEASLLLARLGVDTPTVDAGLDLSEIVGELEAAFGDYVAAQDPDDRDMLEEMRAETVGRYAAWLAFVAAAAGRAEGPLNSPLHVLLSVEGAKDSLPRWLKAPASVTRLSVARDDLLASVEAAQWLAKLARAAAL